MIDEHPYGDDVITQVLAVTKALRSVALELLEEHLGHCVSAAIVTGGSEADDHSLIGIGPSDAKDGRVGHVPWADLYTRAGSGGRWLLEGIRQSFV
jgi:hypothetical protein